MMSTSDAASDAELDASLKRILTTYKQVATVGLSADVTKDSFGVATYLKREGFHLTPINPKAAEILGEKVYTSLLDIPKTRAIEVVQLFRPAGEAPALVDQAIQIGAKVVWMQLGIVNEAAAQKAREAGLEVVMDHCMMEEHKRLVRPKEVVN